MDKKLIVLLSVSIIVVGAIVFAGVKSIGNEREVFSQKQKVKQDRIDKIKMEERAAKVKARGIKDAIDRRAAAAVAAIRKAREDKRWKEIQKAKAKAKANAQKIVVAKKSKSNTWEDILRRELYGFFMDIPEVKWVNFDNNSIYVGFSPYPNDGEAILRGAALHGNKAIDFGVHVWAVPASQTDRTSVDRIYKEVTARYGRISVW